MKIVKQVTVTMTIKETEDIIKKSLVENGIKVESVEFVDSNGEPKHIANVVLTGIEK